MRSLGAESNNSSNNNNWMKAVTSTSTYRAYICKPARGVFHSSAKSECIFAACWVSRSHFTLTTFGTVDRLPWVVQGSQPEQVCMTTFTWRGFREEHGVLSVSDAQKCRQVPPCLTNQGKWGRVLYSKLKKQGRPGGSPGRTVTTEAKSLPQRPRFDPSPGYLLHVMPSISPAFPVSLHTVTIKITQKWLKVFVTKYRKTQTKAEKLTLNPQLENSRELWKLQEKGNQHTQAPVGKQ